MLSRIALPNSNVPYKFGFNGKMNDDEVKGLGNQQDYGMRIYDARIGKFLSVDPLTQDYPWYTPYQFAGNTPIQAVDLDGLEPAAAGKQAGDIVHEKTGQSWKWDGKTWVDNSKLQEVVVTAKRPLSRNFTEWYSHNSKKYDTQIAAYEAWQSYPGYHNGEGKWDRMFRLMGHGSKEARKEYASGGYDMFGGSGVRAVAKTTTAIVENTTAVEKSTIAVEEAATELAFDAEAFSDKIVAINKTTEGGGRILSTSPSSVINSAMYYPTIAEQGSAIFRSIIKNHMFIDGNKRTAVMAFEAYAKLHGLKTVSRQEILNVATKVATNQVTEVSEISKLLIK
ncbi:type II toxin-antitoxin system death-on-curing family toxin [Niastella caeni]|uniref:Type II toxin-antitoxin system death-on-curing family toxin n=2 Tax=Niastella caeni TaxID=2569763 RepID=A0A4S8HBS9_9BACT|nr:type II toxin-antitoxin system death-on-curing family toxin [Niastella caeni]